LQAPGVAQDSYGQLHVRGDHADLQYRINGIIIPEGITGFGQTLDTHFADKIDLLTGALPAQYGYRTAGIVDIATKTGDFGNGGRTSIIGGSNDTLEANQEAYDTQGRLNYYLTGTYDQNNRGIEPPTSGARALHDDTQQDKEFGYLSYVLNPENRLSLIFGNATSRFEIPDNPGQPQQFTLAGTPEFRSENIDERQYERNTYGVAALQGSMRCRPVSGAEEAEARRPLIGREHLRNRGA
jgi:outer membrane cobalamin receptor